MPVSDTPLSSFRRKVTRKPLRIRSQSSLVRFNLRAIFSEIEDGMKTSDSMKSERRDTPSRPGVSASQLRCILMGAICALFLNNLMISSSATRRLSKSSESMIPLDFYSTSDRHFEESTLNAGRKLLNDDADDPRRLRNPRTLMGIFSSDNIFDGTHRTWHRRLFNDIWKDERVCTLHQFRTSNDTSFQQKCELIYTFVVGRSIDDPNFPTERLEDADTADTPIEFPGGYKSPVKEDINWPDVTHLNIR